MYKTQIPRFDGTTDETVVYAVSSFPYDQLEHTWTRCNRRGKGKAKKYSNSFGAFDIETTTIETKKLYNKYGECMGYESPPFGFMYHWQICLNGLVCIGRTWEEFHTFLDVVIDTLDITEDNRLVLYVHNLGFEFEFMHVFLREWYGDFKVFAPQKRKPLYLCTPNGIEFRCSYKLTNMTLAKACENEKGVIHRKASGDLDYRVVRTSATELTQTELGYCVADVVCLYELIENRLANEGDNLESIPLTSTGYVRRDCRNATRKEPKYRDWFLSTQIDKEVYTLLKEAGRGGNTHANRYLSGREWHGIDGISSYDVASSYPAQMLMFDGFPMSKFTRYGKIKSMAEFETLIKDYACIFRIAFENLRLRKDVAMPYLPISKALSYSRKCALDNGRVLHSAGTTIVYTLTNIDYEIVKSQYQWDSVAVGKLYFAKRGMLPASLRGQVMEYFKLKTELKDRIKHATSDTEKTDLEYLYAKSKNRLNGIFGMCYTDPLHPTIELDEDGTWTEVPADIENGLVKYYRSRNSFLNYAHGIFITASARLWLERLLNVTNYNGGLIYCDTDSSKCFNEDKSLIDKLNEEVKALADEKGAYYDYNSTRYYLGVYENETEHGKYKAFKTLGAKKYAYIDSDNNLHCTISGVSKKLGAKELETLDNFKSGFVFKEAGGLTLYYNDINLIYDIEIDGVTMQTASNIGMIESEYTLGITDEYAELIGYNMLDNE